MQGTDLESDTCGMKSVLLNIEREHSISCKYLKVTGSMFYSITQQVFNGLHKVKECSTENGKKTQTLKCVTGLKRVSWIIKSKSHITTCCFKDRAWFSRLSISTPPSKDHCGVSFRSFFQTWQYNKCTCRPPGTKSETLPAHTKQRIWHNLFLPFKISWKNLPSCCCIGKLGVGPGIARLWRSSLTWVRHQPVSRQHGSRKPTLTQRCALVLIW